MKVEKYQNLVCIKVNHNISLDISSNISWWIVKNTLYGTYYISAYLISKPPKPTKEEIELLELRKEIRNTANEIMFNSGLNILRWPSFFTDEKGNLKFEIMEPKQSVHIKPKYYIKNINNKTNILWKLL